MGTYEFTLRLDREVNEDEADALYGAIDDGSVMTGGGQTEIEFTREAASWADAIGSAIAAIETVPGLVVTGAGQQDLVSVSDIAHRARRSREAVRLWTTGKRGPGGFPKPAWESPAGEKFWSWSLVAAWIRSALNLAVEAEPDELRWADEVLKARHAVTDAQRVLNESDSMRRVFGPLLEEVCQ